MVRSGQSIPGKMRADKDFRNPEKMQKLVDYCHLDQYGSNIAKSIFDPKGFAADEYYNVLSPFGWHVLAWHWLATLCARMHGFC